MKSTLELATEDIPAKTAPKQYGPYVMETGISRNHTRFSDMARDMKEGNSFFFADVTEATKLMREIDKAHGPGNYTSQSYDGSDSEQPSSGTRVWRESRPVRVRKPRAKKTVIAPAA